MRFLTRALLAVVILLILLAALGWLLPAEVRVQRSTVIERPPTHVLAQLDRLAELQRWLPWVDAASLRRMGSARGVGARAAWGGSQPGAVEVVDLLGERRIDWLLQLPELPAARARFELSDLPAGTRLHWSLTLDLGHHPLARLAGLWMDRRYGPQLERGLLALKQRVEALPATDYRALGPEQMQLSARTLWVVQSHADSAAQIAPTVTETFAALLQTCPEARARQPELWTIELGAAWQVLAGIAPFIGNADCGALETLELPASRAVRIVHVGPPEGLTEVYRALDSYVQVYGLQADGRRWEHYISDPSSAQPGDRVIHVYLGLR